MEGWQLCSEFMYSLSMSRSFLVFAVALHGRDQLRRLTANIISECCLWCAALRHCVSGGLLSEQHRLARSSSQDSLLTDSIVGRRKKSLHKLLARAAPAMMKTVHTTMICGRSFCTLVFHCWRSLMTSDAQRQRSCARQLRATFKVVPIPTTQILYTSHITPHILIEYVSL